MSRKGRRSLTPEEHELWNKVRERATPLHPERRQPLEAQINTSKQDPPKNPTISPFRLGEKRTETALPPVLSPSISDQLAQQPVQMDRKAFTQLKRGKLKPERRIDLHGMTLARAHPALNGFILDAWVDGLRLVLVITGKGKDRADYGPIPVRRGVLKHQVPQWLRTPPLSQAVMQVSEAHLKHGGTGAYYVYLRRHR